MFLVSLKSLKGKLILLIAVIAAAAVLCVVFSRSDKQTVSEPADNTLNYSASTEEERQNFAKQLGFTVLSEPENVSDVIIPQEFDEVYTQYNELQKQAELDLEPYKGCTVKKWTYIITDYPEYENQTCIRLNLLVYKGKIIGGDVCNIELDGFMLPLK